MERGKSEGFAHSIDDLIATDGTGVRDGGNTKAIEVTSERSESWQQDMAQAIIPDMSCPQSV
jgi:hypothetical protein